MKFSGWSAMFDATHQSVAFGSLRRTDRRCGILRPLLRRGRRSVSTAGMARAAARVARNRPDSSSTWVALDATDSGDRGARDAEEPMIDSPQNFAHRFHRIAR